METPCKPWTGRLDRKGYGRAPKRFGTDLAHRQVFTVEVGPIPEGMTVDHLCFNNQCVNTEHLRLLTLLENQRNQRSAYKTHCVNGHEYTPDNTYVRPGSSGGRRDCRTCIRSRVARYKAGKTA